MKPTRRFVFFLEKMFLSILGCNDDASPFHEIIINKMLFDKTNLTVLPKESPVEIKLEKMIKPPDNVVIPS
jgi:hypothetical protein